MICSSKALPKSKERRVWRKIHWRDIQSEKETVGTPKGSKWGENESFAKLPCGCSFIIQGIVENDSSISEEEKDNLHENISTVLEKKFGSKKPIPEALICPISKVLMKEPICNEHGNSYSKKNYQEELVKNGKIDPLTSKPIKIGVTYANVNLKKAIERFLEENPWAYDESLSWSVSKWGDKSIQLKVLLY